MSDLSVELDVWLAPLLARLQPRQVRALARTLSVELRDRQAKRIAAQRNPDGSPYEPRRKDAFKRRFVGAHRREHNRIKAMFARLRNRTHLKARSSPSEASVQIEGRSARIARVHQFGLVDRPQPSGPEVRYPARMLLGWSDDDLRTLLDALKDALLASR